MISPVKILLQFNGSNYVGWQSQKDSGPAVQDVLNNALKKIFKTDKIKTQGSGRTDSGVHSLDHHVKFWPPFHIDNDKLLRAINSNLPKDIRAKSIVDSTLSFRPTSDAISREYRYLFTNLDIENPFQKDFMVNVPFELDFNLMKDACKIFEGKHNFINYSCKGSEVSSTVRTIYSCELLFNESNFHEIFPDHYYIRVVGSGFLKQMVRLITGAIWDIGKGKLSLEDIRHSLLQDSSEVSRHLAPVAPGQGLYKIKVKY